MIAAHDAVLFPRQVARCTVGLGLRRRHGLSSTIQVYSTLGRFFEHSTPEFLIGSADLMTRNLSRRMEVVAPVCDPVIQVELETILRTYEHDNCSAWDMQPNGEYVRRHPAAGEARRCAQQVFIERSASS